MRIIINYFHYVKNYICDKCKYYSMDHDLNVIFLDERSNNYKYIY
jgi:hypothetical protein